MQAQRPQTGEIAQIVERLNGIRKIEFLDRPQLVRHEIGSRALAQKLAHIGVHPGVRERHCFHNAADGVARVGSVTHKAVFRDAHGDDLAFTGFERNGAGVEILLGGGEVAVQNGVDRAVCSGDGHVDVFIIIAAFRRDDRRSWTHGVDLRFDGGVGDAVEHGLRVEKLALLHICLGERDVQIRRIGDLRDGVDQRVFGLCIVAAHLVRVGQPDGKRRVLRRKAHGEPIERDRTAIAAGIIEMIAPVCKNGLGQIAACDQEKAARADQKREDQNDR